MDSPFQATCLNLGCGKGIRVTTDSEKWINLDMFPNPGVDVVHDLENPLPFEDESIDAILASHVLEHIKNWTGLMKECHRVLRPRGVLHIKVPEARCRAAYADPTHINYFVPETWLHFAKEIDIGFDTAEGLREWNLCWNEHIAHYRSGIDDGVPGNYFSELLVDLEKPGPKYEWEIAVEKVQNVQQ